MAVLCGFYNSVNEDRKYDAIQISSLFDGLIRDGVFMSIGDALNVRVGAGMNVIVGSGRTWFDHSWTYNDSDLIVPIEQSDGVLPRIDTVILEMDSSVGVRNNQITVLKGNTGTVPAPLPLTKTITKKQYPLAYVYVGANVTGFIQANLTNAIGTSDCPYVTGILETVNIDNLIAQWGSDWDAWVSVQTTDFDAWFQGMKDQLSTDAAGNLQLQIDAITGNRTLVDNTNPVATASPLNSILNFLATQIRRITGQLSWAAAAPTNLTALSSHNHSAAPGLKINQSGIADNAGIRDVQLARPKVSNRIGGSATDWTITGFETYTGIESRIQLGRAAVATGDHIVTFPVPFKAGTKPVVFIQYDFEYGKSVTVPKAQITNTGFQVWVSLWPELMGDPGPLEFSFVAFGEA